MPKPSSNLTISDVARALGVSRTTVSAALSDNGRLLSVASPQNLPIAEHGVGRLFSVSHPYDEIAQYAVEMLDSRLTGRYDGPPRHKVVRGELIERDSVRPLN